MEITKKTYIKGDQSELKLENLMKIAQEFHHGNWSAMVLETIIKHYDLDPDTCAPRRSLKGSSIKPVNSRP